MTKALLTSLFLLPSTVLYAAMLSQPSPLLSFLSTPDYDTLRVDTQHGTFERMGEEGTRDYNWARSWTSNRYQTTMLHTYKPDGETPWPLLRVSPLDGGSFWVSDGVYTFTAPEGYVISAVEFRSFNPGNCGRFFYDEDGDEYTITPQVPATLKLTGLEAQTYSVTLVSARTDADVSNLDDAIYIQIRREGLPAPEDASGSGADEQVDADGVKVCTDNGIFNRSSDNPSDKGYGYARSWIWGETGKVVLSAIDDRSKPAYNILCLPSFRYIQLNIGTYTITAPRGYVIKSYTFAKVTPGQDVTLTADNLSDPFVFPENLTTTLKVDCHGEQETQFHVSVAVPGYCSPVTGCGVGDMALQGGLFLEFVTEQEWATQVQNVHTSLSMPNASPVYDLQGRRMANSQTVQSTNRQINIIGGRKVVR